MLLSTFLRVAAKRLGRSESRVDLGRPPLARRVPVIGLILGLLLAASVEAAVKGIWISPAELANLPTSGSAWNRLQAAADADLVDDPDILSRTSDHNMKTLAAALVYARTRIVGYRRKAADAILRVIGSETQRDKGLSTLLARNLSGYVFAADLIDIQRFYPRLDARFRVWLNQLQRKRFKDGSLITNDERRANNHGRASGASRAAVAVYLGNTLALARAAQVFKGWLGDRASYAGFRYVEDLSWQANPRAPVGINPLGATKLGHSIDGALPEEMRRGCEFKFPPCTTTYTWGALQGALIEAQVLSRQGYDVWNWEDQALLRAARFLHRLDVQFGNWWAKGDDTWQPWLINYVYGTRFPTKPANIGKSMGFTDWMFAY
jgi:hypothetical protein